MGTTPSVLVNPEKLDFGSSPESSSPASSSSPESSSPASWSSPESSSPASSSSPKTHRIESVRSLCIGINYSKTGNALGGCVNDAVNHHQFISSRYLELNHQSIVLLDQAHPDFGSGDGIPTRHNIIKALKWLLSDDDARSFSDYETPGEGNKENVLYYLHYSGHGSQVHDQNGDEDDGLDETICPITPSGQIDRCITDDEIKLIIDQRMNHRSVLAAVFDCCHSGTQVDLKYRYTGSTFVADDKQVDTPGQVIVISGCRDHKYSYDLHTGGALSISYLKILKSQRLLELPSLITAIRTEISRLIGTRQLPQLSTGQFPIHRYPL